MDALPLHRRYLVPLVKAYVGRELPGWGRLYDKTIGSYQNDHLWKGEPVEVVTSKFRGYRFLADPGEWSDRMAIFLGRWYDKAALELLAEKIEPGDTVVDIGANYGHFTLAAAAQVGRKGRVLAFEPNPVAFSRMSENLQLNRFQQVETWQLALSDESGRATLYVPRINSGEATLGHSAYADVSEVEVQVVRGDEAIGDANPKLIKIDVEGFEARVIAGLDKTLTRARPLVLIEMIDDHLRAAGSSSKELALMMEARGYVGHTLGMSRRGLGYRLSLESWSAESSSEDVLWTPT